MGVVSGIGGLVDGESCVREWKIRTQRIAPPGAHSQSQSGTVRECGNTDWRGFYTGYGYLPTQFPGDTFEFKGEVGPDTSDLGATCPAGGAIVDRVTITWDVEQGKKIEYRVDFSSNGALTLGAADATDGATPVLVCAQGMTVNTGIDVTDIRYMQLVMMAENRAYVSSDTAGIVKRTRGNFDARFTYRLYHDTPASLVTLNTPQIYKFNVTDDPYFWELKWMMAERIDPYGPNLEGAENLGGTVHGAFTGFSGTTAGHVKTPAAAPATKWPYS